MASATDQKWIVAFFHRSYQKYQMPTNIGHDIRKGNSSEIGVMHNFQKKVVLLNWILLNKNNLMKDSADFES